MFQTRMPRRFEIAVGAVIRMVLSTMFHRWKATHVVHERIFCCSGRGHMPMDSVNVRVEQVKFCYMFHRAFVAVHDMNGDNW